MPLFPRRRSRLSKLIGNGRRLRLVQPRVEPLEGRALLATSALDPTFGTGGLVVGTSADFYSASASTIQSDGKIVTTGSFVATSTGSKTSSIYVRRYNANGSVDSSFGSGGLLNLPAPTMTTMVGITPTNIVVQSNGTIDLAYTASTTTPNGDIHNGVVAQLTATGQLDSTFGTNGQYEVATAGSSLTAVAVGTNGRIVALGSTPGSSGTSLNQVLAIRLTAAGGLDTTFNSTGQVTLDPSKSAQNSYTPAAIVIAPSGEITVAFQQFVFGALGLISTGTGILADITSDGMLDTTYGSSGFVSLPAGGSTEIRGITLQASGNLVVVGMNTASSSSANVPFLLRLLPTGASDTLFQGVPLATTQSYSANPEPEFDSVAVGTDGTITVGGTSGITSKTGSRQLLVERFTTNGAVDTTFGQYGRVTVSVPTPSGTTYPVLSSPDVLLTPANKIAIATSQIATGSSGNASSQTMLAQIVSVHIFITATNDFEGVGKSDVAAELTNLGIYAYRKANGAGDSLQTFGSKGFGASIPVIGDFDGDGKPDIAVYLPALGDCAYRPSSGGDDVLVQYGPKGTGASIPAPGDYFGTGITDMAVYLPAQAAFAIRGPNGYGNVLIPFGIKGAGQSIPAPGDYDGDGKTDLAVYIPSQGVLAYRSSATGKDVSTSFGSVGQGATIPTPGDYDGDGKTDVAVYLPASASFAIHPSSGVANYLIPFGMKGSYNSIPAPGDYDGDGKTDTAVYLPTLGLYAYRPTSGGNDVVQGFGQQGYGATVPAASIAYAQPLTSSGGTGARVVTGPAQPAVDIPLTADLLDLINPAGQTKKKSVPTVG